MKTVKLMVASVGIASLLLVGGCKDDPVKMMEKMVEEICACETAECMEQVQEKYAKKAGEGKQQELSADQMKKVEELGGKMMDCIMKAAGMPDMGAAAGGGEPAAGGDTGGDTGGDDGDDDAADDDGGDDDDE
jgi:hypothetical protein